MKPNKVSDQIRRQGWEQVWDKVEKQVGDQIRRQVWDQIRRQVWEQVWRQAWDPGETVWRKLLRYA